MGAARPCGSSGLSARDDQGLPWFGIWYTKVAG
jgi:hypothetical protein